MNHRDQYPFHRRPARSTGYKPRPIIQPPTFGQVMLGMLMWAVSIVAMTLVAVRLIKWVIA